MEVTPGFEPGNKVLQTYALPLGYVTLKKLAGVEGFEPPNDGIRIRCLTAWRYPCVENDYSTIFNFVKQYFCLGWVVGFEPTRTGATTLGLNRLTTPTAKKMATRTGLEPVTSSVTGWHSNQLNYRAIKW